MSEDQPDEGRNPRVKGSPDTRNPPPLSAEGDTVDANPPVDEPVGEMPNGPEYSDDEEPEEADRSPYAKEE